MIEGLALGLEYIGSGGGGIGPTLGAMYWPDGSLMYWPDGALMKWPNAA